RLTPTVYSAPASSLRACFCRYTDNLRTDYKGWGRDLLIVHLLETGTFNFDTSFPVGMAAVSQPLPKRCDQVLNPPQPAAPRRCHMLDKQQFSARLQNPQHFV